MKAPLRTQRGISLIEALVAMAIMGFGMLGVLGMQATLRGNSDISKQRSEAVRIAQAQMESRRSFSALESGGGGRAFADIVAVSSAAAAQANANTSFERVELVTSFPTGSADQDYLAARKSVIVDVRWLDRNNTEQQVTLGSIITGTAPELAVAVTTPAVGSALQNPSGRHFTVPREAVHIVGTRTSEFTPPNAPTGVRWIFSDTTGFIQQTCLGGICTDFSGRLLAGYVRFATANAQPTTTDARIPTSTRIAGTRVEVTLTAPAQPVPGVPLACYLNEASSTFVAYYCALPIGAVPNPWWTGTSEVAGLPLASTLSDATAASFRVCRYTAVRTQADPPAVANRDHPYVYQEVQESLVDQNFLVIRAGNGTTAFTCPDDTELTGRTMDHQPRLP